MSSPETISRRLHKGKEVLVVDYSNCRGDKLIDVFENARMQILAENRHVMILNIFNAKTFVSPQFMRHVENNISTVDNLVDKQAIIGISRVQEWILKGLNLWYERKVHKFDSIEEALDYLAD